MKAFLAAILVVFLPATAMAQDDAADRAAIERTALDYIEGWYTQDAARMERALHPQLVKRRVGMDPAGGGVWYLEDTSGLRLVQATRPAPGESATPLANRRREVVILDIYGNAASVKVEADAWVDYLHLVKWNGEWKILNVLWELRPEQ